LIEVSECVQIVTAENTEHILNHMKKKTNQNKYIGETMTVSFDEFKGKKVIVIKRDENDQYPFSFGKANAKKVVDNYKAIKAFAEED